MNAEKQSSDSQAMTDLPKRLRIKASMIALGERIPWGSDTALMEEAADMIEALSASVENHQLHMLGMARERDQLRALLAAQSAPAGESEAPVVVAWQDAENPLYTTAERRVMHEWANNQYPIVELMTVAQHNRILAGVHQQRDKLAGLLLGLKVSVRDRAAGRAILADDVYKLIDAALSEPAP